MERLVDKYLDPIAEPVRGARCPPAVLAQSKAAQSRRHEFTDADGLRRERMSMAVIGASYFLRSGRVLENDVLDRLYRDDQPAVTSPPRAGEDR